MNLENNPKFSNERKAPKSKDLRSTGLATSSRILHGPAMRLGRPLVQVPFNKVRLVLGAPEAKSYIFALRRLKARALRQNLSA
eukprot:1667342-Rhodomonas_salina.1